MTKASHTPGPWTACITTFKGKPCGFHITGERFGSVRPIADCREDWLADAEEQKANAYLIAAAPALLEALVEAAEQLQIAAEKVGFCGYGDGQGRKSGAGDGIPFGGVISRSRAAINKARAA